MSRDDVICAFALAFVATGCAPARDTRTAMRPGYSPAAPAYSPAAVAPQPPPSPTMAPGPPPTAAQPAPSVTPAPGSSNTYAPRDGDTAPHAFRGLSFGGGPSETVRPMMTSIPSPPPTIDVPPRAGVDAALRAVSNVPSGHLSKTALEAPLRDPMHFARCNVPRGTRVDINAVIYNGAAVGVDVWTTPRDAALSFCIERVVRETSWVRELAANQVRVTL